MRRMLWISSIVMAFVVMRAGVALPPQLAVQRRITNTNESPRPATHPNSDAPSSRAPGDAQPGGAPSHSKRSGNTLDESYDQGGPGTGRVITADSGPVQIAGPDGLGVEGPTRAASIFSQGPSGYVSINEYSASNVPAIKFKNNVADNDWVFYHGDDNRLLLVSRSANAKFQVAGQSGYTADLVVDGRTVTGVLQITGGADIAEPFQFASPAPMRNGSLVVIDQSNPGQLALSTQPYDRGVAGVLSGAGGIRPGVTLSQSGVAPSGRNVALAGRVYAMADASNGAIHPGDLLTTSSVPGHAMKVTDFERAHGAVIGKAMSSLEHGEGLVLVLVDLQ